MRPVDVMDQIIGFPDGDRMPLEDEDIAIQVWATLMVQLKSDKSHMPMSPTEVDRAKRVIARIQQSITVAEQRNPSHFRPVEPGGR